MFVLHHIKSCSTVKPSNTAPWVFHYSFITFISKCFKRNGKYEMYLFFLTGSSAVESLKNWNNHDCAKCAANIYCHYVPSLSHPLIISDSLFLIPADVPCYNFSSPSSFFTPHLSSLHPRLVLFPFYLPHPSFISPSYQTSDTLSVHLSCAPHSFSRACPISLPALHLTRTPPCLTFSSDSRCLCVSPFNVFQPHFIFRSQNLKIFSGQRGCWALPSPSVLMQMHHISLFCYVCICF